MTYILYCNTTPPIGRFVGGEFWESQKWFVVIGIFIGDGLVTTILTIIVLLTRSTWLMPY